MLQDITIFFMMAECVSESVSEELDVMFSKIDHRRISLSSFLTIYCTPLVEDSCGCSGTVEINQTEVQEFGRIKWIRKDRRCQEDQSMNTNFLSWLSVTESLFLD